MPRYFFQVTEDEVLPDLEGTEMSDLAAARHAAADIAADRLKSSGEDFWKGKRWHLKVIDETGSVVVALTMAEGTVTIS